MRRAPAGVVAVLAAGVFGFAWVGDARAADGGAPLMVSGKLTPLVTGFGDPVTARVRVLLDPERVDPSSLRLRTAFDPWREERRIVRRELDGNLVEVTYVLRLTCHSIPCVSQERQWEFRFADARLRYLEGGAEESRLVAWPSLEVATRIPRGFEPPDDGGPEAPPVWRASVEVPEPTLRVAPRRLQAGLVGAGVLLIVASLALAALALRRPRAPKAVPPLERALAMLARARTAAERRAALEAVAVELHPALAESARELAWSESAPTEPAARRLSERVRETAP